MASFQSVALLGSGRNIVPTGQPPACAAVVATKVCKYAMKPKRLNATRCSANDE